FSATRLSGTFVGLFLRDTGRRDEHETRRDVFPESKRGHDLLLVEAPHSNAHARANLPNRGRLAESIEVGCPTWPKLSGHANCRCDSPLRSSRAVCAQR